MTTRSHAVFVRSNPTPRMAPLREALEGLGFEAVASFGASGNFVFRTWGADRALLQRRVSEILGAQALVRTAEELRAIVASDPYAGREGASVFLAQGPVDATRAVFRDASGPEGESPVAFRDTVYFVWPTRLPGRKGVVDFERELEISGTMRTSRVVSRVFQLMHA